MDNAVLVGFAVLAVAAGIGYGIEKFRTWGKVAAVLATMALIVEMLLQLFRP